MLNSFDVLIAEAVKLGGEDICFGGHGWVADDGHPYPFGNEHCSQTMFRCSRCGDYDYNGEIGYKECLVNCVTFDFK